MPNIETYKDEAIERITTEYESLTPDEAAFIGNVIIDTLYSFKRDLVDHVSVNCLNGMKERLEQALSVLRTA